MTEAIVRKGRGFEKEAHLGRSHKSQRNPGYLASEEGRLDAPIFLDEEPDREDIGFTGKRRPTPHQRTNQRAPPVTPPREVNGGVKLGIPPCTPSPSARHGQEAEKPRVKIRPGAQVWSPPHRRAPTSPEQSQSADNIMIEQLEVSKLDFSKMTRQATVQTLDQALKSQPIGSGKPKEQAAAVSTPHLQSTPHPPAEQGPSVIGPPLEGPSHRRQAKNLGSAPMPTNVLVGALKSLPRRPSSHKGPRDSGFSSILAATTPIAKELGKEIPQHHEATVVHVSETSKVVTEAQIGIQVEESLASMDTTVSRTEDQVSHQLEASTVAIELETKIQLEESLESTDITVSRTEHYEAHQLETSTVSVDAQAEESLTSTEYMPSGTEEFESYQLGVDERFASESSDESESVTSTIQDYENVSENGESEENEAASGDEIVRKKRPKRKAVETSDGKVYYPVAENEEPYVPLTYEIPLKEFTRLVSMKTDSKFRFWTHTLYQHEEKKITVECCTSLEEFEIAAQKFLNERVIGFDMEWLSRRSKRICDNVSLIQLAKEDHIALFHLGGLRKENVDELVSPSLRAVLESKDILKVGVSVAGDGARIRKYLKLDPQGLMELSQIHHILEYARERRSGQIPKVLVALTKLAEKYLLLPIAKGPVRISDWSKPLTPTQIDYAATDAYAGLRIFDALQKARMLISPIPMLPPCVRCNEDKKKRVVSPKRYIDGVEIGATTGSTWNTNFEAAVDTTQNDGTAGVMDVVMDWAQEVEDSRLADHAAAKKKPKPTRKKPATDNTASMNGEPSSQGRSRVTRPPRSKPPLSPEVQFATEWAKKHEAERTVGRTTHSPLRAYALWHFKRCSLEDTAKHLNIGVTTAAQYINQAVWIDKLAYDRDRIQHVKDMNPRARYWGGR